MKVPNDKIVLRSYDVTTNSYTVKQGGEVVTDSQIKLIGRSNTPPKVEETLALVRPDGRAGDPQDAKVYPVAAVDGAGEYKSTGKFVIPKGLPQGKYAVKSRLSLDGKIVANKSFNIQVAYMDGNQVVRLASAE